MTSRSLVQTNLLAIRANLPLATQCWVPCEQFAFTRHSWLVHCKSRNSQTLPADDFARRELMDSRISVVFVDRHGAVDQFPMIECFAGIAVCELSVLLVSRSNTSLLGR